MNRRLAILLALVLLVAPKLAAAWWNDDWTQRKSVTIDASPSGVPLTEAVGRFPVLVRLHDGVFPFAQALERGQDIRFIADDDQTPLAFHLEEFDPLLGLGFAWVDVPGLKPGTKTNIWLYYGNPKAADVANAAATYDGDTLLTYHFGERNTPPADASAYHNAATTAGKFVDAALIGHGLHLDGATPVTLPASPSLAIAEGAAMTLSLWLKMDALQPNAILYSRRDGSNALTLGIDQGVPFVQVTDASGSKRSSGGTPLTAGSWQHIALVGTGNQFRIFVDGVSGASLDAVTPALAGSATLGTDAASTTVPPAVDAPYAGPGANPAAAGKAAHAPAHAPGATGASNPAHTPTMLAPGGFIGDIDELQIAKVARSESYLKAQVASEGAGPDARLVALGADEESSSWLTGYFAILINAVTPDGWVVIGVLAAMSVVSWLVMVSKTAFVNRQARANRRFQHLFDRVTHRLDAVHREEPEVLLANGGTISARERRALHASPMFRLFALGAAELRGRFAAADSEAPSTVRPVLESHASATLRSRMDAQLLRETQALNRSMVLLTIAISGGPFLGLLGTVIGVMITFAAVAAAGDVNVNAIAPGIAAALVATVAGLAVAIPALFGYNYLLTRIKDLTADMRVFVDEYTTRLAEVYRISPRQIESLLAAE